MKRRTALKLSLLALTLTSASAYDVTKIVNKNKMKKKDPYYPSIGELKHTPEIKVGTVDSNGYVDVTVIVGEEGNIHPSTDGHWIYKIELYANDKKVSSVDLEPGISNGYLSSKVKKEGLAQLKAISWCNLHGEWENTINV